MAPGAPERPLDASLDLLGNVSVRQDLVPTGRFMGGRELQHLCQGADPALADTDVLGTLLARGVLALPGFESQGGPFRARVGSVVDMGGPVALAALSPAERATLAAMYSAQMTAWVIDRVGGPSPVVVEGPFAHNRVYTGTLAALLPHDSVLLSTDALEGTARGAWLLAHWTDPEVSASPARRAQPMHATASRAAYARWQQNISAVPA
jgi:sugar (pentulose or hexulose) kinase